jgi:hypothetical protein
MCAPRRRAARHCCGEDRRTGERPNHTSIRHWAHQRSHPQLTARHAAARHTAATPLRRSPVRCDAARCVATQARLLNAEATAADALARAHALAQRLDEVRPHCSGGSAGTAVAGGRFLCRYCRRSSMLWIGIVLVASTGHYPARRLQSIPLVQWCKALNPLNTTAHIEPGANTTGLYTGRTGRVTAAPAGEGAGGGVRGQAGCARQARGADREPGSRRSGRYRRVGRGVG